MNPLATSSLEELLKAFVFEGFYHLESVAWCATQSSRITPGCKVACVAGHPARATCNVYAYVISCVYTISWIDTMRTNIVIDDKLMNEALKATGLTTKKEAVEMGLKALVRLKKQERIRKFKGKLSWEGDLSGMRRNR